VESKEQEFVSEERRR